LFAAMNARSPLADAFATDAPGWDRPAFERQIALLGELAEAGLEIVHAIRDQAVTAAADGAAASDPRVDFGLAYARAAKAVRMTLALQRSYHLDLRFEFRHGEPAPAWDRPAKARATEADRIRHGLDTGGLSEAKAVKQLDETLDLYERLTDLVEDLDDDIPDGPFNEIVGKLCKDLGLAPDWLERTEEALARVTSPIAVAMAGGGPHADPGAKPGEERVVEGAGRKRYASRSPFRDSS
jgi:hypothetical protein